MDIRTAILKAAARIERDPLCYNFFKGSVSGCGPGCAIVWACREAGIIEGQVTLRESPLGFGFGDLTDFSAATGFYASRPITEGTFGSDANACAALMRAYADARFPAPPRLLPNWHALATAPRIRDDAPAEGVAT